MKSDWTQSSVDRAKFRHTHDATEISTKSSKKKRGKVKFTVKAGSWTIRRFVKRTDAENCVNSLNKNGSANYFGTIKIEEIK